VRSANPATLSPLVAALFPPGVIAAELRADADASMLPPEEMRHVEHAVPRRQREFAAGRLCARRAAVELGIANLSLPVNPDRRPCWPAALVGSITHATGYCAAVIAERTRFRSIGVDAEVVGHVTEDVWPHVFTPSESAWLRARPRREQPRCAAAVFSAKEAFYKCQYEVTSRWLEFDEVVLDLCFDRADGGAFGVSLLTPGGDLHERALSGATGRFCFHAGLVLTGIAFG
jgi:4'-phosphopantetheinyl transferase EntD